MNKIFRVKRNSSGQSVVTSEIAKSHTKSRVIASALAVAVTGLMVSGMASAAEAGGYTNVDGQYKFADGSPNDPNSTSLDANHLAAISGKSVVLGAGSLVDVPNLSNYGYNTVLLNGKMVDGRTALGITSIIPSSVYANSEAYTSSSAGFSSVAIGGASIDRIGGIAIGKNSFGNGGTAIGSYSYAHNQLAVALGNSAIANSNGIAVGGAAVADSHNSIAIGKESSVAKDSNFSIAIGDKASVTATGDNSVALGANSVADKENTISVGSDTLKRQIVNVADGTISADSTDAVNGSQLFALTEVINNLPTTDVVAGDGITVTKATSGTTDTYTVALSDATKQSITKAQTDATQALADAKVADDKATAAQTAVDALKPIVDKNTADIANLQDTKADKTYVDAELAKKADKTDVDAKNAAQDAEIAKKADKTDLEALKENITTTIQPALDAKADKVDVDARNATQDAEIAKKADKSDLNALNDAKADKVDVDTKNAAQDAEIANKADKLDLNALNDAKADKADVDAKNTAQDTEIAKKANKSDLDALNNAAVKYDGADKSTVTLAGDDGTTIANVKDGIEPTDAVNVRQLNQQGNIINQRIDNLADNVKKNKKRNDAGIASTAAMANIPQVMLAGKSGVGVGVGHRSGQNAIAIGYSRASDNAKHIIKLSAGLDTQSKATFGAGYMYQW